MLYAYYDWMLVLSMLMTLIYVFMWHKHFDVHITLVFVLVPVINLGYCLLCRTQTLEEALNANRLTYIGGCFLMPIIMFSVFSLCHIKLSRWVRVGVLTLGTGVFFTAMMTGRNTLFYRSITFALEDGAVILTKEYGPMHTVFYAMIFAELALTIGAMVYSYVRKNQVSRKLIYLLFLPAVLTVVSFFGGRWLTPRVELIPAAYTVAQATYLVIGYRICLYDITDSVVDSMVQTGDTGIISIDFHLNYLGSNGTARAIFPELNDLTVDRPLAHASQMRETVLKWLEAFQADESKNQAHYECEDRCYMVRVGYLFDALRRRGYQFVITDDTKDQRYIKLINRFNTQLQSEVSEKTAHIIEMHDKLVMGMATMVESRDNSTGGHIRRTSEGVRLLVDEIRADGEIALSEEFCQKLIKAAPMHDLGKIAVDDAVLRKPGRFTPEEFEKMKAHAAEGARIVREILRGVEDDDFRHIAQNVAHYHHERWDGSGYPEGLKGEEIPIEARIMAIADVYDALVSKRVYKDSMSFEQADAIIMDGMGKHFDAHLKPYYLRARPKLEAYYSSLNAG